MNFKGLFNAQLAFAHLVYNKDLLPKWLLFLVHCFLSWWYWTCLLYTSRRWYWTVVTLIVITLCLSVLSSLIVRICRWLSTRLKNSTLKWFFMRPGRTWIGSALVKLPERWLVIVQNVFILLCLIKLPFLDLVNRCIQDNLYPLNPSLLFVILLHPLLEYFLEGFYQRLINLSLIPTGKLAHNRLVKDLWSDWCLWILRLILV